MLTSRLLKLQEAPLNELVFFLDYDGSLCPHLEVWEERVYDPKEIYDLVSGLKSGGAREIYWNTGRRVESLGGVCDEFLEFPGYFIQGSVYWDSKTKIETLVGEALPDGLAEYYSRTLRGWSGLRMEVKKSSLRIAPYQNGHMEQLREYFSKVAHSDLTGWQWHVGARGGELLSHRYDKRFAVRDGLERSPGIPVAIGDDTLDRPAIEEVIARGGYAILVGEHCGWATEIEHKASQLSYCNDISQAKGLLRSLIK